MGDMPLPLDEWRMGLKSLFVDEITRKKKLFKLSSLYTFDGPEDPKDHVWNYRSKMELKKGSEA